VQRTPVVLDELVRHATDALAAEARDGDIEMVTVLGRERLIVAGDRRRLERALAHVLANRIQSTPPGGRIVVELERSGGEARIAVTDTGGGIADGVLPDMFDPFRQGVDRAPTSERGALGLYVARQCMEMHGGHLLAESDGPGRGARITFVLPLAETHASSGVDAAPVSSHAAPLETRPLDGVRVLVVDDEEDTRDLMSAILEHQGAIVITAGDVETALHAFDASPVDVVLSDLALPGRSGLELPGELRSRASSETTLVAVSGYAAPEQVERALGAGFDFHLAKPIDPSELVELVAGAARLRIH
jgi:CheY-like chemotaxis protein